MRCEFLRVHLYVWRTSQCSRECYLVVCTKILYLLVQLLLRVHGYTVRLAYEISLSSRAVAAQSSRLPGTFGVRTTPCLRAVAVRNSGFLSRAFGVRSWLNC